MKAPTGWVNLMIRLTTLILAVCTIPASARACVVGNGTSGSWSSRFLRACADSHLAVRRRAVLRVDLYFL